MVVKCIKTRIENDNPIIINKDMHEYLEVGNEYIVYGIRISNESNYFMIFNDGNLFEVPISLFDVVKGEVSPLWVARSDDTNNITLWPKLFYEADFFENFSEWEEKERYDFNHLKQFFDESNGI